MFDIKTLFGVWGLPHALLMNFFLLIFKSIKSIENPYKIYRTDLLSRKFHLGDLCMKGKLVFAFFLSFGYDFDIRYL